MARGVEAELVRVGEFGGGRVEILSEAGAGESAIEFGDGFGGGEKRRAHYLETLREALKDANDFGGFFFGELDELIVGLDGFQRLEENGLAGVAGSMHDTRDGAALFCA